MKEVRFGSSHGNYNLLAPSDYQWNVFMEVIEDDGTRHVISQTFDDDPIWGGMDPVEVAELIDEKIQSAWINTSKEKSAEFLKFVHTNANEIRETYYEGEIANRREKIRRLETEIVQLQHKVMEIWDDMGVE